MIYIHTAPSTFVCIATAFGQPSFRVAALCRVRTHNIASVEWLLGALGGDAVRTRLSDFQPSDMICCTPELERKFQQRFDAYGDSYVERLDEDNLRRIIDQMDVEVSVYTLGIYKNPVNSYSDMLKVYISSFYIRNPLII